MSSSAIPHVISFLTRPLLAAFPPASVTSAQLILTASLASIPSATFLLKATSAPPAPIFAASIGAGIPWAAWCSALAGGSDVPVLLFYGPAFLKVRIGAGAVTDVWRGAQTEGKPAAPLLQHSWTTAARLRGALLSARVRSMRRAQRIVPAAESSSDSDASDSESDSGCSSVSSASSRTSAASSPHKAAPVAPSDPVTAVYRAPKGTYRASRPPQHQRTPCASKTQRVPAKTDLTAYLYQGGITRVMTGGVMLGPRRA